MEGRLPDNSGRHKSGEGAGCLSDFGGNVASVVVCISGCRHTTGWWGREAAVWGELPVLGPGENQIPNHPGNAIQAARRPPLCTMTVAGVVIIFVNFLSTVC